MTKVSLLIIDPGRKYRLRWRDGDKHRSRTINGSARAAERARADLEDRLSGGGSAPTNLTFGRLHDEMVEARAKRWTDKTRDGYSQTYDAHVEPFMATLLLGRVNRAGFIEAWLDELASAGVGQEAQRKALGRVRAILRFGERREYVAGNAALVVDMPKRPPRKVVRPLTPEQVEMLRAHALSLGHFRDAMIFSLLAYCGLRPGELFGLVAGSIDGDKLVIDRRRTLKLTAEGEVVKRGGQVEASTKMAVDRLVDVSPPVMAELREYLIAVGRPEGDELLFPKGTGGPLTDYDYGNWRRRRFNPAAEAAGREDATPYTLRHTCASLLLWSGRSISYVARQLGHSPAVCLRTYQHVVDDLEFAERVPVELLITRARDKVERGEIDGDAKAAGA